MTVTTAPLTSPAETGFVRNFFARGWQWPLLIVALLAIPVIAGGYLAYMATHDPTFAIESDYYRKAVAWDQTMAQEQANRQLGWQTVVTATPAGQNLDVAVKLQDRTGAAISGAQVHVEGFFLARSKDLQAGDAGLQADGQYHVTLPLNHHGLHELRLRVMQGSQTFTATHRVDVAR